LYWFRTPPGVRVGRSALDEDAIRLIEAHNPHVDFDWTRILKGQDAPVEPPRQHPSQERRSRARAPRELPSVPSSPPPVAAAPAQRPVIPVTPAPAVPTLPPPNLAAEDGDQPPAADEAGTAAHVRLGSEGLSRLRARHAEVLARISEKVEDEARRDELKSQAERLNPDTWVTDEEVTAGLEAYESVFESLRGVVGRRRKRRRRSSTGDRPAGSPAAESAAMPSEHAAGDADPEGTDDGETPGE
jgi:hypothetical protein